MIFASAAAWSASGWARPAVDTEPLQLKRIHEMLQLGDFLIVGSDVWFPVTSPFTAAVGGRSFRSVPIGALDRSAGRPILHHMAKFQGSQLDRTFAALVDPTRRAILARLEQEESVSIGELARPFAIKLPAVMKHLDVLGTAGLITRSKKGRTVAVRLAPEPMQEAMNWLRRYERFWSASLDRLAAYAEAEEAKAGTAKAQENTA